MLRDIVFGKDIEELKSVLRETPVNQAGLDDALLAAISVGAETTRLLLQFGANPTFRPEVGLPPIHFAIEDGTPEIVQMLVEAGADVNTTHRGLTPLHYAIENEFDIASNSNFEEQPCGFTKTLLDLGADPLIQDEEGLNALEFAQQRRHLQAVALIGEFLNSEKPTEKE